jgi:hypothetical protein
MFTCRLASWNFRYEYFILKDKTISLIELLGFAQHKFICNSELHSVCAPGFCSESLSRKLHHGSYRSSSLSSKTFQSTSSTKSKKLREHFEYNHIPAMISSLQNYSVHGIVNGCSISGLNHGDTIMLLIYSAVLEKTKFIIVDLKLNRYVCAVGDDYNGLIQAKKVYAAWSMDRTQVILRVPIVGGITALDFYKGMMNNFPSIASFRFLFSYKKRSEVIPPNCFC